MIRFVPQEDDSEGHLQHDLERRSETRESKSPFNSKQEWGWGRHKRENSGSLQGVNTGS